MLFLPSFFGLHGEIRFAGIIQTGLLFFISHLYSYLASRKTERDANIFLLFLFPYARILPMHLTILLAGFASPAALPIFLVLKVFADCTMHAIEKVRYAKPAEEISNEVV